MLELEEGPRLELVVVKELQGSLSGPLVDVVVDDRRVVVADISSIVVDYRRVVEDRGESCGDRAGGEGLCDCGGDGLGWGGDGGCYILTGY